MTAWKEWIKENPDIVLWACTVAAAFIALGASLIMDPPR
jgi:hypothetical protein